MKASELRIGNKAFYKEKVVEIASVSGINYSFGNQDITISTSDNSLLSVDILQLQPIPLTPELLEKCGFKSNHPTYYYIPIEDNCLHVYYSNNGLYGYNVKYMHAYLGEIKYLHQLQNLYFALTGEELEIDLKTLQQ